MSSGSFGVKNVLVPCSLSAETGCRFSGTSITTTMNEGESGITMQRIVSRTKVKIVVNSKYERNKAAVSKRGV